MDTGDLENSWRQQPGTPAYCTELTQDELDVAVKQADATKVPHNRDKVLALLNQDKSE
ncbi:hypothetical protein ACUW9N_001380 [Staphylococcus auricularis]